MLLGGRAVVQSLQDFHNVCCSRIACSCQHLMEAAKGPAALVLIAAPADHDAVTGIFQAAAVPNGLDVVSGRRAIGMLLRLMALLPVRLQESWREGVA